MASTKNERAGNGRATHAAGQTVRAADLRATLIYIGISHQSCTCEDSSLCCLCKHALVELIKCFLLRDAGGKLFFYGWRSEFKLKPVRATLYCIASPLLLNIKRPINVH